MPEQDCKADPICEKERKIPAPLNKLFAALDQLNAEAAALRRNWPVGAWPVYRAVELNLVPVPNKSESSEEVYYEKRTEEVLKPEIGQAICGSNRVQV